jgi:O-antigen ligase
MIQSFVLGCVLSVTILLTRACYLFFSEHQKAFFYENFSPFFHPTYLSLYIDFSIAVLLLGGDNMAKMKVYWKCIFILLFVISVLLLSSKAGILALILVLLVSLIILASARKKVGFVFLLAGILACIYFSLNFFISDQQNRFKISEKIFNKNGWDKTSVESSVSRIFVWQSCLNLIQANPVLGVGTGDVKDELIKTYEQNGITGALTKRLNAHNQFLQTAVALGLTGFLILAVSLFLPLIRFCILKEWLYVVFLLVVIFNFLFESMLERQDGIMFYAFFNSLLYYNAENKLKNEHYTGN